MQTLTQQVSGEANTFVEEIEVGGIKRGGVALHMNMDSWPHSCWSRNVRKKGTGGATSHVEVLGRAKVIEHHPDDPARIRMVPFHH